VRQRRVVLVLFLLLTPVALGAQCSILSPGGGDPRSLDEARERWEAAAVDDYTLVLRRSCFCIAREPVRIEVRDGQSVSYTLVGTGQPLPAEQREWYPTVAGLFEFLQEARDRDAARIDVRYHDRLGYPVHVWVDYDERLADEEMGYDIDSFEASNDL
jgi:hypothetical protein